MPIPPWVSSGPPQRHRRRLTWVDVLGEWIIPLVMLAAFAACVLLLLAGLLVAVL